MIDRFLFPKYKSGIMQMGGKQYQHVCESSRTAWEEQNGVSAPHSRALARDFRSVVSSPTTPQINLSSNLGRIKLLIAGRWRKRAVTPAEMQISPRELPISCILPRSTRAINSSKRITRGGRFLFLESGEMAGGFSRDKSCV
ncbi:hypothetical protein BaRGS_00039881 [Batillaria attramentaria]|uniref:Uncharacterized protein n=1 Tax=Batillaria attramentaria TaxID=370345 RepID=A0ABD0J1S4_9CAEN